MFGHLDDHPDLATLSEPEFAAALAEEIMLTIAFYTEDGKPVPMGPYPVDMIHEIAANMIRCVRAYDDARD